VKINMGFFGPWVALGIHLFIEAIVITMRVIQGKWKYVKI